MLILTECHVIYSIISIDPLLQTTTQPNITFYDKPKVGKFTSSGGHADFNNGVEITILPQAIPQGSTIRIKVQPCFASSNMSVMPEGIQSASPPYLISCDDPASLDGEVTVTMDHHVRVSTKEEADDLVFLQADLVPKQSASGCAHVYREVSEGRSKFIPGEKKGKLFMKSFRKKLVKVGLKVKKWLGGILNY